MYRLSDFFKVLDDIAPVKYSLKLIEQGDYDNSGILIHNHDNVEKVLFSLDLSVNAVEFAKKQKCDTIVTHHPAIYNPIKKLDIEDASSLALIKAIEFGLNVVSMHLNLDVAKNGIDYWLCKGLKAEKHKILDVLEEDVGYGRYFEIQETSLSQFISSVKETFRTRKIIAYGNNNRKIKNVASFCGAGSAYALDMLNSKLKDVDLIVTSDMPHHAIKEFVEKGISILLLPHYVAENYGFKKYYEQATNNARGEVCTCYYEDKRFI